VELYKEKPRDRVISLEEFETLTSHMPEHTADITTVAYYSGMRKGEILSLKWGQVNLAERLVYLEETKSMYLYMMVSQFEILDGHLRELVD
jgi:integrase